MCSTWPTRSAPWPRTTAPATAPSTTWAGPERSVFVVGTGQSGNPLSSHYEDYAEPWRDGRYLPMLTERSAVEEDALGTLVLTPR